MQAFPRTIQDVLAGDRRFVIPVYQRPYVWDRERQWQPLWEDLEATVVRLIEVRSAAYAKSMPIEKADETASPHFLGAVVLEQYPTATGALEQRSVVDGQQRMTTLQLLLRGLHDALAATEATPQLVARVRKLIQNDADIVQGDDLSKVWPRPADRADFLAAMTNDQVAEADSPFAEARIFFAQAAESFITDDGIEPDPYHPEEGDEARAALLVAAVLGLVKLVVIDLDQSDDAQIIFEALNARGTPLSATDLVKNLLFMRAQREHLDAQTLYDDVWARFDDDADWWRESVGVGHAQRAREDWLLGDWLIAERGKVINVGRLYGEFRTWLDQTATKPAAAFETLNAFADAYEALSGRRPGLTATERRTVQRIGRLNITAATPLLLWLVVQPSDVISRSGRELAFSAVESYVIRRMAAKWQTRAYGQAFADVLKAAKASSSPSNAVIDALRSGPHGYEWPADADIEEQFSSSRYYGPGGINQGRLRMILGAIDFALQTENVKSESLDIDYDSLQVEHVIPQQWKKFWPITAADDAQRTVMEMERSSHVHRIGNLTLATAPLNLSLSNDPWAEKRSELKKHSILKLNALLCDEDVWDEQHITERGRWLAQRFAEVWPGPDAALWNGLERG